MEKECKFCGEIIKYDKPQQLGGHLVNCLLNPNRKERLEKISRSKKKVKLFNLTCSKCKEEYQVEITQEKFNKGKYNKFCSRKCANSRRDRKSVV